MQMNAQSSQISLSDIAGRTGISLSEIVDRGEYKDAFREQRIADLKADRRLRIGMASVLIVLFVLLNGVVVWMVARAVANDASLISAGTIQPDQRLITENVYMSLVGATVVQLSSILFAIARYLFPSAKNEGKT